jgi:hypothetical protein
MSTSAIQSRVPAEDYFALPALSISRLKELRRSPLHYRHLIEHPKSSPAMTLGTAAHCATLEPERFTRDFVIWDRRTESGRMSPRTGKAWDAFVAEAGSRTVLTSDEHAEASDMAMAVRLDPVAAKYLERGEPEVSLQWELGDRRCKGRADWITHLDGEPVLVGLKTARSCLPFVFGSAAAKLGYHLQWAFYFDGFRSITGKTPRMIEIVVESAPPHAVVVYVIPEDVLDQGRDEYVELLRILADCEARDEWPGPATTEQILTLPTWVYGQAEDDISELQLEA